MAEKLTGAATQEQIAEWKEKNAEVFALRADGHIGYVRRPGRRDLSFANAGSNQGKDAIKFNEVLLNNIWLGGSDAIKKDDKLFLAVSGKLGELIDVAEAELEKL